MIANLPRYVENREINETTQITTGQKTCYTSKNQNLLQHLRYTHVEHGGTDKNSDGSMDLCILGTARNPQNQSALRPQRPKNG